MNEIIRVDLKNKTILTDDGKIHLLRVGNDLEEIFKDQKESQKLFYSIETLTEEQKIVLSKEYILSCHKELSELLDSFPWKIHRKNVPNKTTREETLEEMIDVFKYLLNVALINGYSSDDFVRMFNYKTQLVKERHDEEFKA